MKKKGIIGTAIATLIIVSALSGCFDLLEMFGEEDYNTGISRDSLNNLETKRYKKGCHDFGGEHGCWHGNRVEDYRELIISPMNNEVIVTAMKSGEGARSVEVTCYATIVYAGGVNSFTGYLTGDGIRLK